MLQVVVPAELARREVRVGPADLDHRRDRHVLFVLDLDHAALAQAVDVGDEQEAQHHVGLPVAQALGAHALHEQRNGGVRAGGAPLRVGLVRDAQAAHAFEVDGVRVPRADDRVCDGGRDLVARMILRL